MSQTLEVKYRCMRPSCCVNCREGVLSLSEDVFNELKAPFQEPELFRSPKGICRLGFSQPFKVVKLDLLSDAPAQEPVEALDPADDPILVLVAEHKAVVKKLEAIEEQIRKRDVEGLWVSTKDIENDITLHSGIKEEEVLFPAISGLLLLGESLVSIIREEHREIISLLHNFRTALELGEINDTIIDSMVVSLKSHIRKEDQEFFETLDKCLNNELRKKIAADMRAVEECFIRAEPGDRLMNLKRASEKAVFDEQVAALRQNISDGCCH